LSQLFGVVSASLPHQNQAVATNDQTQVPHIPVQPRLHVVLQSFVQTRRALAGDWEMEYCHQSRFCLQRSGKLRQDPEVSSLLANFVSLNGHVCWGYDPKANLATVDRYHRQPDVVTNDHTFTQLTIEH
jgi:hypothetical protein